ncbi:DNA polymerase III subunit alpha [Flavilitoribacter nigricans]|uniref:DNA-directed DNA polymerase n=1 Tax=Flavilitoribacter nigricans (strain ATCC 23147 / DSM 23189 / NBRC 102662 / NCIMB 1420 / SS-2) TaxID=1122177 RepID=A0A2D0N5K7_FLAN2|nr:DNA polymerase III subunit alpha [Flavilitoribacter nigricans]PHN03812.1 DNA polymerase III subunit alpha [Flavilitoribacter nigricans DSM 23189 = NBRC 102662]
MYINCHSYYSLNYGLASPEELVEAAKDKGLKTIALTDINNVSGAFPFVRACRKQGIHPIIGIEFRDEEQRLCYIGLARNQAGFAVLNKHLTDIYEQGIRPTAPRLEQVIIIYPRLVKPLEHFRDYEYVGIRPQDINRLFNSPLRRRQDRLLAWCPVTLLEESDHDLHRVLRAVGKNELITRLEPEDYASPTERFFPIRQLLPVYGLYPQIIQNTAAVVRDCNIDFETQRSYNRQTFTSSADEDRELLRKLALEGCDRRYGRRDSAARKRVEKELQAIDKLRFVSYFLIIWDLIQYARHSDIVHVGRGSGANSIVAYCIGITDVDPLELNLYFERFINEERSSMPDFDVDFPSDQRHRILDYVFKRYGRRHTAFVCTYNTFQFRSIMREVGKVYGLPKAEIDRIVASPQSSGEHHELAGEIWTYAHRLADIPNELSVHASGVIISEHPLFEFSALRPMPFGFPIVHFDMYTAEDWGFNKYDILGQCGLSHIRDCVRYVKQNHGKAVDIDPKNVFHDPDAKALLRQGDTVGVFYAESPNMRELLPKLQCDNYPDLVVASSIIRPGVASSGMMREYIRRHHEPYTIEYLHHTFAEHLAETYGVMVFQEDVMKICHAFAGLSLAESDVLRKIMSGKNRFSETFQQLKHKFFTNSKKQGHAETLTEEVWRQISSFAGYSFCKAHSAAFAVLSFQDLYLKAHYPLEFLLAVINNFGGFYRTEIYVHEARRMGAVIHAPCVNHSDYLSCLHGEQLYLGLGLILGLEKALGEEIVYNRQQYGPYRSLADFVSRIDCAPTQLELLFKINSFRFTGLNKYQLMWEKYQGASVQNQQATPSLFATPGEKTELPELKEGTFDQAFDEIELLKFPLCSPFELLDRDQAQCIAAQTVAARDLPRLTDQSVCILGYFVCRKTTSTKQHELMAFDAWYDEAGDYFNTVIFPKAMRAYPLKGIGIYRLEGTVQVEFGVYSITLTSLEKLPYIGDERFDE